MSDKPVRVYQGVRVRTTVKELLQRHRAEEEANRKKGKTITSACLERQELPSTFPSLHVDPVHSAPPADGPRTLQLRAAPFPVSPCNSQLQESAYIDCQHQLWDMLPGTGCSGSSTNNNNNNNNNIGFSGSLPPPPTLPLPWWHGLSSDADYYGPEVAVCSTPESLKLCSPMDHSYSPQGSFSSSSSSCYDSPSRMESSSYPSFPPEHYHYQQCNPQDCYCLPPFWTGQQDSLSGPEYAAYYSATDYPHACPVDENYFKKDFPVSSEMCYNVL